MATHLESDILECEFKWALGSIAVNKANGGDRNPLSYLKPYKVMLLKCCTQYVSKFGKLSSGHRNEKSQFSLQYQKKGNANECSNYSTIVLISHASKVMLKILQSRHQQYVNRELPDVQAGFTKSRGIRDQIPNIHWIIEK